MGYLSDIARRRIAALLLIVGIAVAVLAITDTGPFSDPPTEEERAQEAVEQLWAAAGEGDFKTYCSLLTKKARETVRRNAARLLEAAGQLRCAEILEVAADTLKGVTLRIREVSVSGPRARVEANLRLRKAGVESRTMFLERDAESGEWLVSDPG